MQQFFPSKHIGSWQTPGISQDISSKLCPVPVYASKDATWRMVPHLPVFCCGAWLRSAMGVAMPMPKDSNSFCSLSCRSRSRTVRSVDVKYSNLKLFLKTNTYVLSAQQGERQAARDFRMADY